MSKKKNSPQWMFIESSNLDAVAYDDDNGSLLVQFKNGAEYEYKGVPRKEFNNMLVADSHGEYFHRNIKPAYEGVRIN
jgi:hypothetical protein